jgi:hypothetical protein
MTPVQRLVIDENEYYRGMMHIYGGMAKFTFGCMKQGIIDDILGKQDI